MLMLFSEKGNSAKVLSYTFAFTLINYLIAYLLSSQEIIIDLKNFSLIFVFTFLWVKLYYLTKSSKKIVCLYIATVFVAFFIPLLAAFFEPLFLQRLMKDFLFYYTLPLIPAGIALCLNYNISKKYAGIFTILSFLLLLLGSLPFLLMTGYYLIFSTKLTIDGILAILQSNTQESLEFITVYFTPEVVSLGAVTIMLILLSVKSIYNRIYLDGITPRQTKVCYFTADYFGFVKYFLCWKNLPGACFSRCFETNGADKKFYC